MSAWHKAAADPAFSVNSWINDGRSKNTNCAPQPSLGPHPCQGETCQSGRATVRLGILKDPRIGRGTFRSLGAGVAGARGGRRGQHVRATGRVPAARTPWSPGVYGARHSLPSGGQKVFPRGLGGPGARSIAGPGWPPRDSPEGFPRRRHGPS